MWTLPEQPGFAQLCGLPVSTLGGWSFLGQSYLSCFGRLNTMGDLWSKLGALILKFNDLCNISPWWSYILLWSSHMVSLHWEGLIRKPLKVVVFLTFIKALKTTYWIKWHMLLSWSKAVHPCILRSREGLPGCTPGVQQAAIGHSTAKSRWNTVFSECWWFLPDTVKRIYGWITRYLAPSCWWSIFSKAGLGTAYYHITTAALCALTLGTELLLLEIGWNKAGQQIFYNPVNYGGGKVFKWLIELVWSSYEILLGSRAERIA